MSLTIRRWQTKGAAASLIALSLTLATPAIAADPIEAIQSNPKALQEAMEAGQKIAFFCNNCHGENGLSKIPEVPNLASQNPTYTLEQMRKFESGERIDKFMQGLIKALKPAERVQLAVFYGNTQIPPHTGAKPADAARGKSLYDARCAPCHGPTASGNHEIPRLAGQPRKYLAISIERYRGRNGIRRNDAMNAATADLSPQDIGALAGYLASMP